ncbi:MAG: TonB-dependent receptor [Salinivirgaceae bacterium]|nr:TonB-dependent receptor [Salinivirgaceae bacterium]
MIFFCTLNIPKVFMCLCFLHIAQIALSQTDTVEIYDFSFDQLSEVKISSATKSIQSVSEVPSTVYIISSQEIVERAYFTLEDVLADFPGFQFRNIQGFNSYSFQRGITNQNNLILLLIDGIQVNELNSGGFYGGGQYNLSNIDQIEVIYGPGSVAYGTNAITGIINIKTKSALKNDVSVNLSGGTFNTFNSDATYNYVNKSKDLKVHFASMLKTTDKANLKGEAGDNNWTENLDTFEDDLAFDLKVNAKNFTIGTNYLLKKASFATYEKSVNTIFKDYGSSWNMQFLNNYISYKKQLNDNLKLTSTLYNRNATVKKNTIRYVVDTAQIGNFRPNNLTGFENILNYNINKYSSVNSGILIEYEQLAKEYSVTVSESPSLPPPIPDKPQMQHNELTSVFVEPAVNLLNKWFFSGGLRLDYSSVYNLVFTPRAGAVYKCKNHKFRISYGEAFRAPKPWDYTDGLGNNSLEPEKMKSIEGAVNISLLKKLNFSLVAYNNHLDNALKTITTPEGFKWGNQGKIITNGAELGFRYSSKKFKSFITYSYCDSKDEEGKQVLEISRHTANASFTYSILQNLHLNVRANYVGKRENPTEISATESKFIDQYLVINGTLSFMDYTNFRVQLIAKNILNAEYYHSSNVLSVERYRQSQRAILLSIGYTIDY